MVISAVPSLAGKTLNTSVTEVMNKSPVTLGENTLGEDVLSLMAEKKSASNSSRKY